MNQVQFSYKQLYRSQQCRYSAQVNIDSIQFNSSVDVANSSIMKHLKAALQKAIV